MKNPSIRVLVAVAALTLLLGACGDDDTDTGIDTSSGGSNASEGEAEELAEDVIEDQLGGECGFLGKFAGAGFDEALNLDPTSALTDGGMAFAAAAEEFQEVADAAPGDIQDAFQALADGMSEFADAFAGMDLSDPSSFDPSVLEDLDNEKFDQASDEVDAWVEEHCPVLDDSAG